MRILAIVFAAISLSSCIDLDNSQGTYLTDAEMQDWFKQNELNFKALVELGDYCTNDPLPAICDEYMTQLKIINYQYSSSGGLIRLETFFDSYGFTGGNTFEKGFLYASSSADATYVHGHIITDEELERDQSHYGQTLKVKIIAVEENYRVWGIYSQQLDD